jgi:hypothetical protein
MRCARWLHQAHSESDFALPADVQRCARTLGPRDRRSVYLVRWCTQKVLRSLCYNSRRAPKCCNGPGHKAKPSASIVLESKTLILKEENVPIDHNERQEMGRRVFQ